MTDKVIDQVYQLWETKKVAVREDRQRGKLIQWSIGGGVSVTAELARPSDLRTRREAK